MREAEPEIVFHLAAQSLVRQSYDEPVETYATNVMGTVHLLEAVRRTAERSRRVIVTSDKCYENGEWVWGYRENDRLGGHDPYSNSKGCAELVTDSLSQQLLPIGRTLCMVASARAGNVIGGGDWARTDWCRMRCAPSGRSRCSDPQSGRNQALAACARSFGGYLLLAERVLEHGAGFAEGWNFGPGAGSEVEVVDRGLSACRLWGDSASWQADGGKHAARGCLSEARLLESPEPPQLASRDRFC